MRLACLAIGLLWAVAAAAEETLYRLPWPDGLTFMFTQAPGGRITTHFTRATLYAVDIAMPEGMPVLAARAGVVEATEANHASPLEEPLSYEGNFVRVRHADGTVAIYAHLKHQGVVVAVRDAVRAGQMLGYSGASGDVLEPQLHFAVLRDDASIPVRFYVGTPAVAFSPRAAVKVTANYSRPAPVPRAPSEGDPLVAWKPHALEADEEALAWRVFALCLACGAAGFAWFWKFSRG